MRVTVDAGDLDRVAVRLHDAAGGGLVEATQNGLMQAAQDLPSRVADHVARVLPRGGGLAARAARSRVEVRGTDSGLEVTVDDNEVNVEAIDAGRVVHPVYGNRRVTVSQSVPAGAFSDPLQDSEDRLREGVEGAVRDLAQHIEQA